MLLRRISEVIDTDDRLRKVLLDYRRANVDLAKLVEAGEPALTSLTKLNAPIRRQTVTESIEAFGSARHQLRLALFVSGKKEGASPSEMGRVLGISRQLASRFAAEAARGHSQN